MGNFVTFTENTFSPAGAAEIVKERQAEKFEWKTVTIESATENMIKCMTSDTEKIKGHDCYFVDFGGHFGYSVCVFYNGHHIYYADDFELHHKTMEKSELRDYYVKKMNAILYDDADLLSPLKSYVDLENRRRYMMNYYPMRQNYMSGFQIFHDDSEREEYGKKQQTEYPYLCNDCFSFFAEKSFVEKIESINKEIKKLQEATSSDVEFWKKAFYDEFFNYECMYGGRYAEAAYNATGGKSLTDIQKKAFKLAKAEFNNYCMENDVY